MRKLPGPHPPDCGNSAARGCCSFEQIAHKAGDPKNAEEQTDVEHSEWQYEH